MKSSKEKVNTWEKATKILEEKFIKANKRFPIERNCKLCQLVLKET